MDTLEMCWPSAGAWPFITLLNQILHLLPCARHTECAFPSNLRSGDGEGLGVENSPTPDLNLPPEAFLAIQAHADVCY